MKKFNSLVLFFLKTVYLSPSNNPGLFCLLIIAALFFAGGGLQKHEVIFLFLMTAMSGKWNSSIKKPSNDLDMFSSSEVMRFIQILPIKEHLVSGAYIVSSVIYISILLSLWYYAGINSELPPNVKSVCPPQTITEYNSAGEPAMYVTGITMIGNSTNNPYAVQYKIPVTQSLIFGYLASTVLINHEAVPDSIMQQLCPQRDEQYSEDFLGVYTIKKKSTESDFLNKLPAQHIKDLLLLALFVFLFFLNDCTRVYIVDQKKCNVLIKGMDFLIHISLFLFFVVLVSDVLLPESIIIKILSMNLPVHSLIFLLFSILIVNIVSKYSSSLKLLRT